METPGNFPLLDLRISHGVYRDGDVSIYLSWLLTTGDPCIVLTRAFAEQHHEKIIPCVVQLDNAYLWAEETAEGNYVDLMAGRFAANLGLDPLKRSDVIRVQGIIRDWLGELINMPPMPTDLRRKVADMLITNNETGEIIHKEVKDYV